MGEFVMPDNIGPLAGAEVDDYENAVHLYRTLISLIDWHIDRATDPARTAELNAAADRYAEEKRELRITDREAVARALRDLPALIDEFEIGVTD
ncbi:hypothetical protein GCM10010168_51450 [Actinoplanes ianthinogenes]|uniref:Uncharacterized protein n=1 Tax=Actinoplanes ianthinogenes TaxID=122358 RepID=A0ABN6CMB4_9ACTN|nr:hypothetical protein [Actinoplanes ianthinogenes]BCJ46196.1 hypothetical protein Aiant_68530 [Actinoplanes ianthinogenes]GGR26968.1 hypothetical protein GCM10010168_51450 [Actinoplanes ianthinogenes]